MTFSLASRELPRTGVLPSDNLTQFRQAIETPSKQCTVAVVIILPTLWIIQPDSGDGIAVCTVAIPRLQ